MERARKRCGVGGERTYRTFQDYPDDPSLDLVQVEDAQQNKVVYIVGRLDLASSPKLNILKRIVLEYFYNPLERNCRTQTDSWNIPRSRLIEVGMSHDV